ncbi:MAG: hypothetical protein K2W93_03875, partial [Burkholderiaceae bacterium]|nr:hypothetical protein [Burkholderiaceae bacterium]
SAYVDGQAAGSLRVLAQQADLAGSMAANTLAGSRQLAGLDALAAAGSFQLGEAQAKGTGVDSKLLVSTQTPPSNPGGAATAVLDASTSFLNVGLLQAAGFGSISLASDRGIASEAGASLQLADRSTLTLYSRGADGISLGADIVSAGGSLSAQTVENTDRRSTPGTIHVADGVKLDMAGRLLNQERDGASVQRAVQGGSVTLNSGAGLLLGQGSVLDVSGGATVRSNGSVQAGNAGSLDLSSSLVAGQAQAFELGGSLLGVGVDKGGSLKLRAATVQIGSNGPVLDKASGGLNLGTEFFSQGGFERFDVDGMLSLQLADGAVLRPQLQSRQGGEVFRGGLSGSRLADLSGLLQQDAAMRRPVSLTLQSSGNTAAAQSGALRIAEGAQILLDPNANLTMTAGRSLQMLGQLTAPGGTVSLTQKPGLGGDATEDALRLGAASRIDVSGLALLQPNGDGLLRGRVLEGGVVTLSAVSAQLDAGALIKADGAQAQLDAAPMGAAFAEGRQSVASAAGALNIAVDVAGRQDSLLNASFQAKAGGSRQADGRLSVKMSKSSDAAQVPAHRLLVQAAPAQGEPVQAQPQAGVKTVQLAQSLLGAPGSLADISLASMDSLVLAGDLQLEAARRLSLDTPL